MGLGITMDDVNLFSRIVESSPVIVLLLLGALFYMARVHHTLWRRNLERTEMFEEAQAKQQEFNTALLREVLTAFNNNTSSNTDLKRAVEANTQATANLERTIERRMGVAT